MSVGTKIKALRKKRGMTQKELADGIVTRGMLSRIESDSALPSMQTLQMLAERLHISPGFLLEDGDDLLPAERQRIVQSIREEFRSGNMQNCLTIFAYSGLKRDPELVGIYVSCTFSAALTSFYSADFSSAKDFLQKAENALPDLLLPLPQVSKERIDFLRMVMEHTQDLNTAITEMHDSPDFAFQPALFFFVLKLLQAGRHNDVRFFTEFANLETQYLTYIEAQLQIKDYKFVDAILKMKNLANTDTCPFFLSLLCHASMENCCKLCEDYKGAYENHIRYQELLSKIQ